MTIERVVVYNTNQEEIAGSSSSDWPNIDIYAARLVSEWQQSEPGKWVMGHVTELPICYHVPNIFNNGYEFYIVAELEEADATFFRLKYK